MILTVTAFYAGLMGLWVLVLSFEVMRRRRRHDVPLGTGGVPELERAVRAHGNATEYVPLSLILLGLAEGLGTSAWVLHLFGLMLLAGRVLHGGHFILGERWEQARSIGMLLTVSGIGALSVGLIIHSLIWMF